MKVNGIEELNEALERIQSEWNEKVNEIEESEHLSNSNKKSLIEGFNRTFTNMRKNEINRSCYHIPADVRKKMVADEEFSLLHSKLFRQYMDEINDPLLSHDEKAKLKERWQKILNDPVGYSEGKYREGEFIRKSIEFIILSALYCLVCWGTGWYFDWTFITSFGWSVQHETLMWLAFIPVVNIVTFMCSVICWAFVFWTTVGAYLLYKIGFLTNWNIYNLFGW